MKNRKSVMDHQFSKVPQATIQRSKFDRSHGYKTTFDGGWLIPMYVDEALPGDTFSLKMTAFARLATPIKPVMDNMYMDTFFFAVPIRLLWDNWQKFNGEQEDPGDSVEFIVPTISQSAGGGSQTLTDYFGLPTDNSSTYSHSALWHRAYNLIYNEWFRDQNLQDSVTVNKTDGVDSGANYVLLRRGKRHDYFTSCLPFPQKGDAITVGLSGNAPVTSDAAEGLNVNIATPIGGNLHSVLDSSGVQVLIGGGIADPLDRTLYADLSLATAISINDLREAFQLQKMLERDARGGTRYTEVIRAHFGVTSPDARLQRPEYLGGGSTPVNITPVEQNTQEQDAGMETPQGNLAAYGTVQLHNHGFTKSFTEHCVIIGLVNVRADLTYQQGMNRMWSRETRFDYFWPALAEIGEQAVLSKEIWLKGQGSAADENVFGYQERYAEYRYKPSQITGKFRSTDAATLDIWHLAQNFGIRPSLDATFISDSPPIDRVIAVQSEPHFLFDAYFNLNCARPMPLYGVPGNIDRF